jgi:hypothetical protein
MGAYAERRDRLKSSERLGNDRGSNLKEERV